MALLPDVTHEDRLINIAKGMAFTLSLVARSTSDKHNRLPKTLVQSNKPIKAGNQWSKPKFQKYPDLNRHLEAQINKQNTIFRYPQPVEKPYSWNHK